MISEQGGYKPKIVFETPKRLEEPALKDADEGNDLKAFSPAGGGEDAPQGVGSPSAEEEPPGASIQAGGGEDDPQGV